MHGMMGYDAVDPTDNDSRSCGEQGGGRGKGKISKKAGAVNEKGSKIIVSNY